MIGKKEPGIDGD